MYETSPAQSWLISVYFIGWFSADSAQPIVPRHFLQEDGVWAHGWCASHRGYNISHPIKTIHQSDKRWAICYLIGQIQKQATYNLVNGAGEEEDEEEEA